MHNSIPGQEVLRELFNYNEETGLLTWRVNRGTVKKAQSVLGRIAQNRWRPLPVREVV